MTKRNRKSNGIPAAFVLAGGTHNLKPKPMQTATELIAARQAARDRQDAERLRLGLEVPLALWVPRRKRLAQVIPIRPEASIFNFGPPRARVPIRPEASTWVSDVPCVGSEDSVRATLSASIVCEGRKRA